MSKASWTERHTRKQVISTGDCNLHIDRMIREKTKNVKKIQPSKGAKQFILLGTFLSFFAVIWIVSPLGIYPDSGSYIAMQPGREPLYCSFLAFFRWIFNEADTIVWLSASGQLDTEKAWEYINKWPALHVSVLCQSILAGFSCYALTQSVKKAFKTGTALTIMVALGTLIPYVLTPLASASHMVLNTAVLTEGLAFPLYYFFLAAMVNGLFAKNDKDKIKHYAIAFVMALLLALTRNQMLVAFGGFFVVVLGELFLRKGARKHILRKGLLLVVLAVLFLELRKGCCDLYNNVALKGYQGTNTGTYNLLTTVLYLSDEEDAQAIADDEERALFLAMRDEMVRQGLTYRDAEDGILNHAYHYEDAYDVIGLEIQMPMLFGYVEKMGVPQGEALNRVVQITSRMVKAVAPAVIPLYIANYGATVVSGFVRSIASSGTIMGYYALLAYFVSALIMVYLYRKDKDSCGAKLLLFAFLMVGINVCATALMIMCLSRYMIYNISLFYIAGLLGLVELGKRMKNGI